jgi:putative two-component system response regulator
LQKAAMPDDRRTMTTSPKEPDNFQILVVDDEEVIREMLQETVAYAGYSCSSAGDGYEALIQVAQRPVDVVITDIKMPGMDGIELLRRIKETHEVDVIVMTGFIEDFTYERIIELGASDFIGKPFRNKELIVRLKRVLRERSLLAKQRKTHQRMVEYSENLSISNKQLRQANREVQEAYLDTINRLAIAAEYRDEETGDHIIRMSRYSAMIGERLGLSEAALNNLRYASPMHDVGKIGIPDMILLKPGKLTADEFEIMKTHTTIGADILSNSRAEILQYAEEIALSHHERWDGTGYPRGLAGEAIPIMGRIVGIADVFDALTSDRPYKDAYPLEVALEILKRERGRHFDPRVVDAFMDLKDEIAAVLHQFNPNRPLSFKAFRWSERETYALSDIIFRAGGS